MKKDSSSRRALSLAWRDDTPDTQKALAFDCANVFDQGIQAITDVEKAWVKAASRSNLAAVKAWQQALWAVPGMFLLDLAQHSWAAYLEIQATAVDLMIQQNRIASEWQANVISAPAEVMAASSKPVIVPRRERAPRGAEKSRMVAA